MIRGWACVLLILVATLAAIPNLPALHGSPQPQAPHSSTFPLKDPNATLTAFNFTYAQADLYTNSSATVSPIVLGTRFDWLNTVPRTTNGSQVQGSAFRFNVTKSAPTTGLQVVNWTLTIPKFNCGNCSSTIVRFAFFGSLTRGTSANYTLSLFPFNRTVVRTGNNTGPGDFPTTVSLSCPAPNVCIDVTKYIGFNVTLAFRFGWNSSQTGMLVEVGELIVGSLDQTFKKSISNSMMLDSTDTSKITHTAKLAPIIYNSTVTYLNGLKTVNIIHTWSMEILDIYYPAGYSITQVLLNSTIISPVPPRVPFDTTPCNDRACSVSLLALNMSDLGLFSRNSTLVVKATSRNTISLSTLAGTASVPSFLPGEKLGLKVGNALTVVNASAAARTGKLNITFVDPTGSNFTIPRLLNFPTVSGGLFNYTLPSAALNPFGLWNITVLFINTFDMGFKFQTFTVQQIQLAPGSFSYTGSNTLLTMTGRLTYANKSAAVNVNGTAFAMDAAFGANPITTTNTSSTGLYISNITLVNAIFTTGQPLRMFFTVVNPGTQGFNATLTIEHEWPGSVSHGVTATFPLDLGDQPFTFGPVVYKADIFLLSTGVQIQVTSLTSHNAKTVTASLGLSPVLSSRQHSGLFKITINSKPLSGSGGFANSLESPLYGYVLAPGFVPGKLLAFSKTFTTRPDGTFSTTFTSAQILAAKKLVLLVLARDGNGIVLGNQDPTGATDTTLLQSSLDAPSEVAVRQPVSLTLHLKNNSTKIGFSLTINIDLGSGVVKSQPAILPPGGQQDVPFTFTAPSSPGVYTLTLSSPEYGVPLLTKTLQVSLLQSNLQILIPAIIGLVAALAILGFYLIKKSPEVAPDAKEKQRSSPGKPSKPPTGQPGSKSLTRT